MGVSKGHGAHIVLETGGVGPIFKSLECAAYINFISYTSGKNAIAGDHHSVNLLPLSETLTIKGIINGPIDCFEKMVTFYLEYKIESSVCVR